MSRRKPYVFNEPPAGSPVYWSSVEELERSVEESKEFRAQLAAEFPSGAGEILDPVSRRNFLGLMGASVAIATAAGCRRPVEKVLPYTRTPENLTPGITQHYTTVMTRRGDALGLLVESHEGRPTKIEGNPEHPGSLGGADLYAQASVLDLYDPDRSRQPAANRRGQLVNESLESFDAAFAAALEQQVAKNGAGLRVLMAPTISPTLRRLRGWVVSRFKDARFHTFEALPTSNIREGARIAWGTAYAAVPQYDKAKVILSLDADFLHTEPGNVRAARAFANGRRLNSSADADSMNRLYVVEPTMTITGSNAEHRLRLPARDIEAYLHALAAELVREHRLDLKGAAAIVQQSALPAGVPEQWIKKVAADLAEHRRASVLVAGSRQPRSVHALVHLINEALEAQGNTVMLAPPADPEQDDPSQVADFAELIKALDAGKVELLLILGVNPVQDAPVDSGFAEKLGKVAMSVHLSHSRDETTAKCTWHVPRSHYLESWGDQIALDGTVSVQQPLIAPMYASRSDAELLAAMTLETARRGHDLVRATMHEVLVGGAPSPLSARTFEKKWRRALFLGRAEVAMPASTTTVAVNADQVATALAARPAAEKLGGGSFELVFLADNKFAFDESGNNAWLRELPDPITKLTWDNAAYVSKADADALSLKNGDVLKIDANGRSVEIVGWIVPGQAEGSIAMSLGWGRRASGRVGDGKGFDVNPLRSFTDWHTTLKAKVAKADRTYPLAQTQEHQSMENRPLAIEATAAQYKARPNFGEFGSPTPRTLPLWREVDYSKGYKWGLSIDLTTCIGCAACMVACQAENNVPVVGKEQVAAGREMYWLRVDRYFSDDIASPQTLYQPVACVQCEEAPCENVCPVNATAHSPEGLNDMAYNRCIGTRYCANNCPYKVRRFNYLNFHNDSVYQPKDADVPESVAMQHNPNVTVRFRGVMEKCSYCVQRIQEGKIAAKRENRTVAANSIQTACQQTCPTGAVVFGDLNNTESAVTRLTNADRRYRLLAELGTQPRTTFLGKVRNPNPEMKG